jgi:hypothetical protein
MVRSSWIGPVIVGLAVTGLAWSQTGSPAPPIAETKERTLTLQEAQRPAQKCKLLRSWRQANGAKAYLVQSLNTGEFITIAEIAEASGSSRAAATKIYHWGDGQNPPADTPGMPNNALILGDPIARFGKVVPPPATTVSYSDVPPASPTIPAQPALVKQEMPLSLPRQADSIPAPTAVPPTLPLPAPVKPEMATPARPALVKQETPPALPIRADSKSTPSVMPPALPSWPAPVKQETPPSLPVRTESKPAPASVPVTTALPDNKTLVPSMGASLSPLPVQPAEAPAIPATSKAPDSDLVIIVPLPNQPESKSPPMTDSKPATRPVVMDANPALPGTPLPLLPDSKSTPPAIVKSTEMPSVSPLTKPALLGMPATLTLDQTAPPADWRQSWGRVDVSVNSSAPTPTTTPTTEPSTSSSVKTAQTPVALTKPVDPLTSGDHPMVKLANPVKAETKRSSDNVPSPQGVVVKADAVVNAPALTKAPVQVAWNSADSRTQTNPTVPVAANPVAPPASVTSLPVVASLSSATSCPPPPCLPQATPCSPTKTCPPIVECLPSTTTCLPPPPPPAPKSTLLPGMQSVAAARQAQPGVQNVQIADGPNAFSPPSGKGADQVASQAAPLPQMSCPPGPMPMIVPSAPMDSGISPALANAFTLPGTTRPIPANFGPPAQVPNAFSDGNTGPVAYAPMPLPSLANPQIPLVDRGPVPVRVVSVSSPIQGTGSPQHLVAILRDSLYPSQRGDAAQALANQDWRAQPQLVEALVKAAKEDPAPIVRAECVHSLAHMGAATLPVVKVCQALKADPDPRVRKEAEQALLALVGSGQYDEALFRPVSGKTQK